jgi:uncharacterized protein
MSHFPEFQIFAKPVGSECNLRCTYCYYLEKKNLYPRERLLMDKSTLENFIKQNFEASTENIVSFSWHGGEPLIAGLDFFRRIVRLQRKYRRTGIKIVNGIQTNGTLLNDEWCKFLARENFVIGMSIDGPEAIHNKFRLSAAGGPSFDKVMRGFNLLKKYNNIPEILCVVNAVNVEYPIEIYDFFKKLGAKFITFLPLVVRKPGAGVSEDSVPAEAFGHFLSKVFDRWVENDIGVIKIQIIEEAIRTAFNQDHSLCIFKVNCGGVPVLEHNGDFYSCDHYVDNEHLVGNINTVKLADLLNNEKQKAFGMAKSSLLPGYCFACEVKAMCNGECPRNRFINSPDGEPGLNYLCDGYKYFFNHIKPFVVTVGDVWKTNM